jgi:hypothetical protein
LPVVDERAAIFRRAPAVEETHVGDRVVLYHRESGNAIVLNPTATILWQGFQPQADIHKLSAELSSHFPDVDHETIMEDVRVCLEELRTEQLIQQIA